jgi:2,3-diketo-5-methylthio-1-phosphopentane phosphatase
MKIAVLSDFDGTLTLQNALNTLYRKFGSPFCKEIEERWDRGEISTMEEITNCFSTFNTSRREMENALRGIALDPAVHQFLRFCHHQSYEFAIVSDGLRWYIDFILSNHDINEVTIYANEIHFTPDGYRFSFPWHDSSSPLRGVSKLSIVRSYQARHYKVVFIGDGLSDTDAIRAADIVYARDELLEYARLQDIQTIAFNGLSDLLDKWELPD